MNFLHLATLTIFISCGSKEASGPEEPPAPQEADVTASPGPRAGTWSFQQIVDGDPVAGVVSEDGARSVSWQLQFGEGIESISYGFVGSHSGQVLATTQLVGDTQTVLSLELQEVTAEQFEARGDELTSTDAQLSEPSSDHALLYSLSLSGGDAITNSLVPGSMRDAETWKASSRQIIGSSVGELREPVILGAEFWVAGDVELGIPRARRGPKDQIQVTFTVDGEQQRLRESSRPAWVFFLLAE